MTEAEWLACANPQKMLEHLRDRLSGRKLRLFAVACCRAIWPLIRGGQRRTAVEVAEQYADGEVTADQLTETARAAEPDVRRLTNDYRGAYSGSSGRPRDDDAICAAYAAYASTTLVTTADALLYVTNRADHAAAAASAHSASKLVARRHHWRVWRELYHEARAFQSRLLREMYGNPFRPVSFRAACRTPTLVQLARAACDERIMPSGHLDPGLLAILADALEEAGCADQAILSHLRGPGPHVRGCWAVDLILGRE
jgi:hypothetical protein